MRSGDEDDDRDRQTRALAGLAIALLLTLIASYLIRRLKEKGEVEDCLLAHRINCDALIDTR